MTGGGTSRKWGNLQKNEEAEKHIKRNRFWDRGITMKCKTNFLSEYSINKENADCVIMEAVVNINEFCINATILLTSSIIQFCGIDNCKNISNNFFRIFEERKIGIIPMKEIIEKTDFSNIFLDNRNNIILLSFSNYCFNKPHNDFIVEFNNEYEIVKIHLPWLLRQKWQIQEFNEDELCKH